MSQDWKKKYKLTPNRQMIRNSDNMTTKFDHCYYKI